MDNFDFIKSKTDIIQGGPGYDGSAQVVEEGLREEDVLTWPPGESREDTPGQEQEGECCRRDGEPPECPGCRSGAKC